MLGPPDALTGVVVLTHAPELDDPALVTALRSEAFYVGALGSRRTQGRRRERLAAAGPVRRGAGPAVGAGRPGPRRRHGGRGGAGDPRRGGRRSARSCRRTADHDRQRHPHLRSPMIGGLILAARGAAPGSATSPSSSRRSRGGRCWSRRSGRRARFRRWSGSWSYSDRGRSVCLTRSISAAPRRSSARTGRAGRRPRCGAGWPSSPVPSG